ncbi:hypothetical protein NW759_013841 [Fusarium solani]|nr:hypothetical protein NW759_013841 [Fusarium solani]
MAALSATTSSLSALFCCIARALGEDPEAAAFVFIAFGFDAQNALACGLLYGLMTEDSHSTPKQQTSITAAANAYRSKAAALSTDNNSSQYKLPNHLDSIFFKAGLL